MKKRAILIFFLLPFLFLFSGCQSDPEKEYKIDLEIWGLFDDRDIFNTIAGNYRKLNPNIGNITFRKFLPDDYKTELIEAMAAGKGPDIYLIRNSWLPHFGDKIYPAPPEIINEQKFRKDFVDVAADNFIEGGKIYSLPLSVDSLALYYNKDLFNEAGIVSPPKDWGEFVEDVRKLTKIDPNNQIIQSGVAMGTAYNINRSTDVLNLLMLQNKTEMFNRNSMRASFNQPVKIGEAMVKPGENALRFYTQFAESGFPIYSWNQQLHYSIDAFSEGTVGMMFNYSWQMATIESKSPKLNYAVAPVPQFNSPSVNFPNYWSYSVAKNKTATMSNPKQAAVSNDVRAKEAWKFLKYLTTNPEGNINVAVNGAKAGNTIDPSYDPAWDYLQKTRKPSARRDLIEKQKTDPKLGVFAEANLIAKDWYQAKPEDIERIFADMIDEINRGASEPDEALDAAAARVTQLSNSK